MRDSSAYDDEEQRIRERLRAKLDNRNNDEHRIRERLRAKLDSRNRNHPSSNTGSNGNGVTSSAAAGIRTEEKNDSKEIKNDNKPENIDDSKKSLRRKRRHRGRRNGNGRGGPPGPPPFGHPYPMGPPYRGSRSPPNHLGPPPGPFGPGYGGPPGPYGGGYHPPFGGPPPPPYGYDWRGPRGPPLPPHGRFGGNVDDFGRRLPPRRSRSRSSSHSPHRRRRSRSYSRSRSRSVDRRRRRSRSRSESPSGSTTSGSMSSSTSSRSSRKTKSTRSSRSLSSSSRSISDEESKSSAGSGPQDKQDPYTKDQRTVFVTQLVLRTTEKEIAKFFKKEGIKTNEVILLRDKRTGRHKGSAYVEMRRMDDVIKSLALSGKPPDFQRFPILVKASEAEKNYTLNKAQVSSPPPESVAAVTMLAKSHIPALAQPLIGLNGKLIQAQKLYVGNLDPSVSQEHLFALFKPFGQLEQVTIQKNESGGSKGFAFLQFRDPKEANLALQTMSGQILAGRPIKTGWASQVSANPNIEVVTSQEFPLDATNRAQNAYLVLAQLTNVNLAMHTIVTAPVSASTHQEISISNGMSRVPTVAEARASLAAQGNARGAALPQQPMVYGTLSSNVITNVVAIDPMKIGNSDNPSKSLLIHNMFNKDEESDPGWENDIRDEFQEECSKYGTIISVKVMHTEPGGKIYATFDSITGAQNCASNLAGRWFDKRQLRVEYVSTALASD